MKHGKSLPNETIPYIIKHLKQERMLKEELNLIVEYTSLHDVPLEERKKEAEKPLYLARYE